MFLLFMPKIFIYMLYHFCIVLSKYPLFSKMCQNIAKSLTFTTNLIFSDFFFTCLHQRTKSLCNLLKFLLDKGVVKDGSSNFAYVSFYSGLFDFYKTGQNSSFVPSLRALLVLGSQLKSHNFCRHRFKVYWKHHVSFYSEALANLQSTKTYFKMMLPT